MIGPITIHKAAGIIIQDRKLLLSRSKNKNIFISPGGKLEQGETSQQALVRELREEQGIIVREADLEFFGSYQAVAAGREAEGTTIRMEVYLVKSYEGTIGPQAEIAENL